MNQFANMVGLAALVVAVVGCCQGTTTLQEGAAKTTVTVTMDGNPVEGASVSFTPTAGGRSATGRTDESGQAEMWTTSAGDGVMAGEYLVSVVKTEVDPSTVVEDPQAYYEEHRRPPPAPKKIAIVPQEYANPKKSGLTATVELDAENDVKLELSSS